MMRAMAMAVLALALGACGQARADAIFKCVTKGKPASYQNQPCGGRSRMASVREYAPDQVSAPPPRASPPVASRATPRRSVQARRASTAHGARSAGDSCEAAKQARDAWERRIGLRRTYEALQAWHDRIRMACK